MAISQRLVFHVSSYTEQLSERENFERLTREMRRAFELLAVTLRDIVGESGISPVFSADIDMQGKKIVNMGNATNDQDGVPLRQMKDTLASELSNFAETTVEEKIKEKGSTDHGEQDGLSDDDHSIYLLLAGRAGGQTGNGGTAAGDDLTLRGTANAANDGDVIVNDLGGNIGLGTASNLTEKVVFPNNAFVGARNAGGTATRKLLGLNGSNELNVGDTTDIGLVRFNAGNELANMSNTIADTETALLIRRNVGGVLTLQRVTMGAVDSGAAGFKLLRVPN